MSEDEDDVGTEGLQGDPLHKTFVKLVWYIQTADELMLSAKEDFKLELIRYMQFLAKCKTKQQILQLITATLFRRIVTLVIMVMAVVDLLLDVYTIGSFYVEGNYGLATFGLIVLMASIITNFIRIIFLSKETNSVRYAHLAAIGRNKREDDDFELLKTADGILRTSGLSSTRIETRQSNKLANPELEEMVIERSVADPELKDPPGPTDDGLLKKTDILDIYERLIRETYPAVHTWTIKTLMCGLIFIGAPSAVLHYYSFTTANKLADILWRSPWAGEKGDRVAQIHIRATFLFFINFQAAEMTLTELVIETVPQLIVRTVPLVKAMMKLGVFEAIGDMTYSEILMLLVPYCIIGLTISSAMVDKLDYYFVNFRIGEKFSWTVKPKRLPDYPYYKVVCIVSHIFILASVILTLAISASTPLGPFPPIMAVAVASYCFFPDHYTWEYRLSNAWVNLLSTLRFLCNEELAFKSMIRASIHRLIFVLTTLVGSCLILYSTVESISDISHAVEVTVTIVGLNVIGIVLSVLDRYTWFESLGAENCQVLTKPKKES